MASSVTCRHKQLWAFDLFQNLLLVFLEHLCDHRVRGMHRNSASDFILSRQLDDGIASPTRANCSKCLRADFLCKWNDLVLQIGRQRLFPVCRLIDELDELFHGRLERILPISAVKIGHDDHKSVAGEQIAKLARSTTFEAENVVIPEDAFRVTLAHVINVDPVETFHFALG